MSTAESPTATLEDHVRLLAGGDVVRDNGIQHRDQAITLYVAGDVASGRAAA